MASFNFVIDEAARQYAEETYKKIERLQARIGEIDAEANHHWGELDRAGRTGRNIKGALWTLSKSKN